MCRPVSGKCSISKAIYTKRGVLNRIRATDETPHILKRNCMHLNGNWSNMLLKIQSTCKKTDDIGPLTARQRLTPLPLPE